MNVTWIHLNVNKKILIDFDFFLQVLLKSKPLDYEAMRFPASIASSSDSVCNRSDGAD